MAPLEPALLEASWPTLATAIADTAPRRALVVLLTALETGGHRGVAAAHARGAHDPPPGRLASVSDPALDEMAARRDSTRHAYDAAAAERTIALRQRTTALLGRLGVTVIDASPENLPPRLADHYLLLKSQGLL